MCWIIFVNAINALNNIEVIIRDQRDLHWIKDTDWKFEKVLIIWNTNQTHQWVSYLYWRTLREIKQRSKKHFFKAIATSRRNKVLGFEEWYIIYCKILWVKNWIKTKIIQKLWVPNEAEMFKIW